MSESPSVGVSTPKAAAIDVVDSDVQATPDDNDKKNIKGKKRALFGFGKKKSSSPGSITPTQQDTSSQAESLSKEMSKLSTSQTSHGGDSRLISPSSPARAFSTSPRLASPAGSQIFERNVQDGTILKPSSPAIPTHIQTENYIPSVLDDASEAITNHKLDPDTVEIVTHTSHQPAAFTVTGAGAGASAAPLDQSSSEWAAELASFADRIGFTGDAASNYGSLDSADVRRLSFISFADVVQSEQAAASSPSGRETMHIPGLTSLPAPGLNRSPSPMRSPVSSQGPGTSPPTSSPGSLRGLEMSPTRKHLGSPGSGGALNLSAPGELNIETMSQALRRTGSRDFSSVRSTPASPIDGPRSR